MVTKTRVSLAEFLAMPETKPYKELIDGEVVEKAMPGRVHSRVVTRLIAKLAAYLDATNEANVDTELRHVDSETDWVFLPDISVTLASRQTVAPRDDDNEPVEVMPDFAIEVLSPEDRTGRVMQRITYYMRAGVTLLWVIDPEDEQVTIWERGKEPRSAMGSETIDARPVLSDFTLDLAELFGALRRP